jgi:hypothetical protein
MRHSQKFGKLTFQLLVKLPVVGEPLAFPYLFEIYLKFL